MDNFQLNYLPWGDVANTREDDELLLVRVNLRHAFDLRHIIVLRGCILPGQQTTKLKTGSPALICLDLVQRV